MNHRYVLFQLSCAILVASVFFACSSTTELASKDEYFQPVEKIIYQKTERSGPPLIITRERSAAHADESIKDAVIEMLRVQNKRLEDVVQQLNLLTNKEVADNSKSSENLGELLATRDRVSNEMLLEMIRDQNQRLNDVVEQLKILAQNQQSPQGVHSNLVARVNVAPEQTPPTLRSAAPRSAPTPKRLDGSLSYGKAIQIYQSKQYEKAIHAFEKLVKRGIEPSLADNCYFWMGVCYFNLKRGNQAIGAFTEIFGYAGSDKIESAHFMVGQCYEQMGAKKFAKMAFEKLLKEYPRGSLKQVTEKKLALLK